MGGLAEVDVTAEVVASDICGVPAKTEAAPTPAPAPVIVAPAGPEPVKGTPGQARARVVRRPVPLNLRTSNSTVPVPAAMKTGGLPTGWVPCSPC